MPDQDDYRHLIESEEKFRDLFDHANDLIHFSSPEGMILYVNAAWITTLGYNEGELQNRFIYEIIHPDDIERFRNYREQILKGEKETSLINFRFIKKDGGFVTVEGYLTVKTKDGKPLYTRAILRNVFSTRSR
ncbi:MAG TPA: PAS domain S-box protein [Chitinophagaceae bacterium]|nr:PAS domain S-box protein [Chitinophagaceae bacterium]